MFQLISAISSIIGVEEDDAKATFELDSDDSDEESLLYKSRVSKQVQTRNEQCASK